MKKSFKETERQVEIIDEADVVVAGGGPAGLAAAICAARNGADVLLIERYGCLGGMATGGLVIQLDNYCNGKDVVVRGIAEEMWRRLEQQKATDIPAWFKRKNVLFDPEAYKWISLQMAEEAGVRMLLHAWAVSTICKDGNIEGLILESKSGRQAVQGRLFIDGTGDGDVACWAGAPFEHGRQGIGVVARAGNVDYQAYREFTRSHPNEWAPIETEARKKGLYRPEVSWRNDVIWFNNGIDADALSVKDLTSVEIQTRKKIQESLQFYRANVAGFEKAFLLDTASQIGTRESRRIICEHTLSSADISGKIFEDSIGKGNRWDKDLITYDIPYRCLIPRNVNNLVVAGRCMSTTHETHNITRTIPLCMVTGQAAGTAAALALKTGVRPAKVEIAKLQQMLREQGANL